MGLEGRTNVLEYDYDNFRWRAGVSRNLWGRDFNFKKKVLKVKILNGRGPVVT